MIDTIRGFFRARKMQKDAERDAVSKRIIAQVFNDRYTYVKQWVEGMPFLPGSYYGGPHRSGYAWMCPDCNQMHHPISDSVFSGLQYPACCTTWAGHRLDLGIKTS